MSGRTETGAEVPICVCVLEVMAFVSLKSSVRTGHAH